MANTSIANFAAIALLFSVNFKSQSSDFTSTGLRIIFSNTFDFVHESKFEHENLIPFQDPKLKKLYIFCKMHLNAIVKGIVYNGKILRDGNTHQSYSVFLTSRQIRNWPTPVNSTHILNFSRME